MKYLSLVLFVLVCLFETSSYASFQEPLSPVGIRPHGHHQNDPDEPRLIRFDTAEKNLLSNDPQNKTKGIDELLALASEPWLGLETKVTYTTSILQLLARYAFDNPNVTQSFPELLKQLISLAQLESVFLFSELPEMIQPAARNADFIASLAAIFIEHRYLDLDKETTYGARTPLMALQHLLWNVRYYSSLENVRKVTQIIISQKKIFALLKDAALNAQREEDRRDALLALAALEGIESTELKEVNNLLSTASNKTIQIAAASVVINHEPEKRKALDILAKALNEEPSFAESTSYDQNAKIRAEHEERQTLAHQILSEAHRDKKIKLPLAVRTRLIKQDIRNTCSLFLLSIYRNVIGGH